MDLSFLEHEDRRSAVRRFSRQLGGTSARRTGGSSKLLAHRDDHIAIVLQVLRVLRLLFG